MNVRIIVFGALLGLSSGCSTWNKLNSLEQGAVIGGGTGIFIGAAVGGAVGAVVGGAAGGGVGALVGHEVARRR